MQCRFCGTLLTLIAISNYWAHVCLNGACKEKRWPTTKASDYENKKPTVETEVAKGEV